MKEIMKTILIILFLATPLLAQPYYKGVNLSDFNYQQGFKARVFNGAPHYYKEYYEGFRLVSIFPNPEPTPAIVFSIERGSIEKWEQVYYELVELVGIEVQSTGYDWKMWVSDKYKIDIRLVYGEDISIVVFPMRVTG